AKNLARLAEVFAGFGSRAEAIATIADALGLEKDDFNLTLRYADLLHQDQQYDAALKQLDSAGKITNTPEDVEQVMVAQIKTFQAMDKLADQIADLQKDVDANPNPPADRWLRLARYYEANRQSDRATETITKAIDAFSRDAQRSANASIPVLTAAARIYESGGDLLAAAETNRKLAAPDRRFRTEYLTAVARLEQRLGRREQALQAGRDLLAAAPGNPDVYKFFADLCFQVGDQDEGLEALRKSVRANPSDPQGLVALGTALAERLRQGEAIELFWRAFEKTNELDGKLTLIDRITHLYLENNQFDRLMERLEREQREADKQREMTLCIAQAYTSAGDLGTARQQLERLLTENTRDTHLLHQLVSLCEQEGDVAAAVKYERQLNAAAPDNYDHRLKLAQLLTRSGEADAAADIWIKLVSGQTEPHRNLTAIDQLISAAKYDSALAILSRMLAQNPGNWELLYREGAVHAARGNTDEAAARFDALLALKLPDDENGENLKFQIKQAKRKNATPGAVSGAPGMTPAMAAALASGTLSPVAAASLAARYDESSIPPISRRTGRSSTIRMAVGMDVRSFSPSLRSQVSAYGPQDYGEARMAALGWLYEFARGKEGADAFVKKFKDAAASRERARPETDTRPLWDWYYLQMLRAERQGVFATALALSQGTDPAGMLVFLQSLGSRSQPSVNRPRRVGEEIKDNTPPLPADQLAHALACYRKLKQTKPDWINSAVTQMVMTELKRAKEEDKEKALYQELVKSANTVNNVIAALAMAANRNELEVCFQLFGRLEKLQPPVKAAAALAQLPTRQAYSSLLTLMGRRADAKQFVDARSVLDLYLTTVRRQNLLAPRSGLSSRAARSFASAGPTSTFGGRRGMPISMSIALYAPAQSVRRAQVTYPSPNDYYDTGSIYLLYNAFDMHKRADLTSDLFAHVRKQLDAAQGAEKLYLHLAIAYLHWWSEEKDEALAELAQAIETAPGDHNLVMEVAALREQNSEFDAALTLLDSITPLDTQMMQRREDAALRVAERTGNLDRARQAADRLFGLRLDAATQVDLAGKMHRLGMHDLAETVLARAQRQAGNRTATLVQLMTQYQSQNQADLAAQIARQILRRGPSTPGGSGPIRSIDDVDNARSQAIGVLARSGQLKEMIERAESQLKSAPKSVQVYQTLVDYYQASGEKEKLKAAVLQMAELRPDDGKLRYQAAQQLQQQGERDAAIAQYKAAIKLEPSLFGNRYYDVQMLFQQANKLPELGQLLDEIDLRKVGSYYTVTEPISEMLRNDKSRDLGVKLFKKAWEAFPQYRSSMLGQLYDDSIWRLPEIYTFAKQAIIPREDSEFDAWQMISDYMSYGQEGRIDGVLTRMLAIARKQQRLSELRAEVQAALAKRPDWQSGKALLAILDIQSGNKEAGKKEWQQLFADPKLDMPAIARFILCQELEYYAGVENLAVKALEGGIEDLFREGRFQFSYHPARRLAWWYEQLGRKEDARKLTQRFAKPQPSDANVSYPPGYVQYQTVSSGISVAQEMMRVGDPVEAVRVYSQLLADRETLEQAALYRGGGPQFEPQVEQGLKNALKALKPSTLPAAVAALLTPREEAPGNGPVLDLIVLVESRDLSKAALMSVFASALESTAKAPDVRKEAFARLADLIKRYPTDYSVQIASALAAFIEGDAAVIREAVDRLVKLAESAPLDVLPPNGKPNARQRAEALQQVPLWLVARECLKNDRSEFWPAGEKLAARAAAAAKRQPDTSLTSAVLREWAKIALDGGDRVQAEARLSEMLEIALPKPDATKRPAPPPGRGRPVAPPPAPPPPPPASVEASARRGSLLARESSHVG
ncbi:MAG TPA: tetratricopeptide repeat protein, partial [Gemmataceae bacterium]|nr:tetratricopeptide repeat protein [Gemmataceae bacterium]